MKYLVTMKALDNTTTKQEMLDQIENLVFPAFEGLMGLEKEGKITGGTALAQRKVVFVADVDSPKVLDKIVRNLPIWGICETDVTPLHSFGEHIALDKELVSRLKNN